MPKRASPIRSDGSDDPDDSQTGFDDPPTSKRRRLVQFDSVRLLSVTGVNDINDKKIRVQVYKLSETLRHKNKVISQKDREIDRLRQRQTTDENTSCTINRHWNNIDEQMRLIILRGAAEVDDVDMASDGVPSSRFLEEVVQMEDGERQEVYDKRIQTSARLLSKIVKSNTARSEQQNAFSKKLLSLMEASTSGGTRDEAMNELVHRNAQMSEENLKLTKDSSNMHQKLSQTLLKLRESEDRITQLETKNEELMQEVDEVKHDLDKALRQVNKLDYKLYTVVKEQRTETTSAAAEEANGCSSKALNAAPSADSENKEMEDLRVECEIQSDLASNRLLEINQLNERYVKLVEETEMLKNEARTKSLDRTNDSKDQEDLAKFFSAAMDENFRLLRDIENCRGELELVRDEQFKRVESMQNEEQLAIRKVLSSSEQINKDNLQVTSDYTMLRMEVEASVKNNTNTDKALELKTLVGSLRAQNNQLKSEGQRLKKKWKDAVNMLAKCQKELDVERQRISRCILVELDDSKSQELESPDVEQPEEMLDESKLRDCIRGLRIQLDAYQCAPSETRNLADIIARERRLKMEHDSLAKKLKSMARMDKKEKIRYFETEHQKQLAAKDAEMAAMVKERDELLTAEGALNQELESIGQAVEELQEQNSNLIKQKQYLEDEKMKMMGDRISSSQIQLKLKEEKALLEIQVQNQMKQMQASSAEHQHVKESLSISKEAMVVKTKENVKLQKSNDVLRREVIEHNIRAQTLATINEKLSEQVNGLEEVVVRRAAQLEQNEQKFRRLDEDINALRKRIERSKKSLNLGSADAVFVEENKRFKEAVTCPSCKVNKKDAILMKCFHVFCMDCLKTRYDTRQRKCPKCNAGFGANDFQRAYLF